MAQVRTELQSPTPAQRQALSIACRRQRQRARRRKIEWELTNEEWFDFWLKENRWEKRGPGKKQYVMSRKNDRGPYAASNIVCQTQQQNGWEAAAIEKRKQIVFGGCLIHLLVGIVGPDRTDREP
jgi:hypothetical protein